MGGEIRMPTFAPSWPTTASVVSATTTLAGAVRESRDSQAPTFNTTASLLAVPNMIMLGASTTWPPRWLGTIFPIALSTVTTTTRAQ